MHIIWKRPDNTIAITYPMVEGLDLIKHAEHLQTMRMVPDDHELVAVGVSIPPRDEFREALVWNGTDVVHDMARAKELRRQQLRRERAPLLAELDIQYQRADETNDAATKVRVAQRKQALRDITADGRFSTAQTLHDLRMIKCP